VDIRYRAWREWADGDACQQVAQNDRLAKPLGNDSADKRSRHREDEVEDQPGAFHRVTSQPRGASPLAVPLSN
jgi:hypothetical protein